MIHLISEHFTRKLIMGDSRRICTVKIVEIDGAWPDKKIEEK